MAKGSHMLSDLSHSIMNMLLGRGVKPPREDVMPMFRQGMWFWANKDDEIHSRCIPSEGLPSGNGHGGSHVPSYEDLRRELGEVEHELKEGHIHEAEHDLERIRKELKEDD